MVKRTVLTSRTSVIVMAAILALTGLMPMLWLNRANAAQVTTRSIQMENSGPSAVGGYKVSFNLASTHTNIEGIVVDFCSDSPIPGLACSAPTGFAVGSTISNLSGITGTWTVASLNSGRTLTLVKAAGDNLSASTTVGFTIDGVTNPSTLGVLYARIFTYTDDALPASYTAIAPGANVDLGGIAMRVVNNLTVYARVQEQLTFCVYASASSNCATGTGSTVDIPDATTALSPTIIQTATANFGLASNALTGVNVRMYGANGSQGVLKSGSNTITAFGTGTDACAADSTTNSVEQFGMRIAAGSGVTAATPYNCSAGNHGWDDVASTDTTTVGSAYGDSIATTAAAQDEVQSSMEFAAKSALTSEAGLYSTSLNYIATGTY